MALGKSPEKGSQMGWWPKMMAGGGGGRASAGHTVLCQEDCTLRSDRPRRLFRGCKPQPPQFQGHLQPMKLLLVSLEDQETL